MPAAAGTVVGSVVGADSVAATQKRRKPVKNMRTLKIIANTKHVHLSIHRVENTVIRSTRTQKDVILSIHHTRRPVSHNGGNLIWIRQISRLQQGNQLSVDFDALLDTTHIFLLLYSKLCAENDVKKKRRVVDILKVEIVSSPCEITLTNTRDIETIAFRKSDNNEV